MLSEWFALALLHLQGFFMKQGVLTTGWPCLLLQRGGINILLCVSSSWSQLFWRTGLCAFMDMEGAPERGGGSLFCGCIVSRDLFVLNLVIVKKAKWNIKEEDEVQMVINILHGPIKDAMVLGDCQTFLQLFERAARAFKVSCYKMEGVSGYKMEGNRCT
ncbi:hypothetical protein RHSIM_Rhsim12G0001200 [Rhododendron simsii]|uniref:Uncharacterized protein n=1 Tax=Rhododendron simsii TaxID=118357 RepID=A0A834G404_RHOSS|nr:hypothetical protein RHSIM_Rhsim12G0001200 [Rhododendron simsii]